MEDDAPDLDELRNILQDIVADDKRAGRVVHRLRHLLKKSDIVREPLDINQVIQEILALLHSDLNIKQVTVDTELADSPAVSGDRVQLQQVILNLVMNGCEAMGDLKTGLGRVVIETTREGDQAIKVAVRDFGNGLNENNLERGPRTAGPVCGL